MIEKINFEKAMRHRGAVKIGDFTTRAGIKANCKLELDNHFLETDLEFAELIARNLADQISDYKPDLLVPIPRGANLLGKLVAKNLGVHYLTLDKPDRHSYRFWNLADRLLVARSESIAAVDDVYTTGGSFRDLYAMPEFAGKINVAGVIWDRSEEDSPRQLDFDLVSVVKRYVPMVVDV